MRKLRSLTLMGGLIMLLVSLVLVMRDARSDSRADLMRSLDADVGTEAARLDEYFERSATVVRQLSENPTFREFYEFDGPREERLVDPEAVREANRALGFLEALYPESIGEACFIDSSGAENARVVRGVVAQPEDLSPDETEAPFFAPTFSLAVGEVYQSEPYLSEDTNEWVVANSTLVPFADGARRAIVHFEVTIDSFRRTDQSDAARFRIVDASGRVVVDSHHAQEIGALLGPTDQEQFRDLAAEVLPNAHSDTTTFATVDDEVVGIRALSSDVVTPNRWYLMTSDAAPTGWLSSLSVSTWMAFIGAGAVFALAIISMLIHEKGLRQQASTDALTQLPNRVLFIDRVNQAIRAAEREGGHLAVLLMDLDRFKEVNDTLGHHRGDQLLQELASRMTRSVRESDSLARLGGDEFAMLLPRTAGLQGAIEAAERLNATISAPTEIEGVPFHIDASIGIALYPDHGRSVEELLQHADVAMYSAKRDGLGYEVYSTQKDPHNADRLALTGELRGAIDRGELVNHYQPKYDLQTMKITGVEALVRWDHPTRGLLAPVDFVPLAEISGLLRPLTVFVMKAAFSQVAEWRGLGSDLTMAVNISPRSLTDPTFLVDLDQAVRSAKVDPRHIVLEITEDSLFSDPEASKAALQLIRRRGFKLSIDDFGTGYSSLTYLRELPVDEIKIDRSFITNLADDPSDRIIAASTISLAQNLGYRVVAEGIETLEALEILKTMGCDSGQGFLMSRPMDSAKLHRHLIADASMTRHD